MLGQSIVYLQSDGAQSSQSYADLLKESERILLDLRQLGLKPQDQLILQLELSQDIIPTFWGCIIGGFIPVIMAVPPTYQEANGALDKLCHIMAAIRQTFDINQWCVNGIRSISISITAI